MMRVAPVTVQENSMQFRMSGCRKYPSLQDIFVFFLTLSLYNFWLLRPLSRSVFSVTFHPWCGYGYFLEPYNALCIELV